jgi:hypothetical protein
MLQCGNNDVACRVCESCDRQFGSGKMADGGINMVVFMFLPGYFRKACHFYRPLDVNT